MELSLKILLDSILKTLVLLPETLEVLKAWEKKGHRLILVTGRKESHRKELEEQLKKAGIFWDHSIMGLSNGPRVVINDVKIADQPSPRQSM